MAPNNGIINRLRGFDAKHYAATDRYARMIEKLFNMASDELAQAARNASYDPSAVFSFNDLPATRRQAQQILSRLVGQLEHVIDNGTKAEWLAACDKNDAFINAILRSSKLSRAEVEQYEDRNLEALRAFQNRKTNGLGLSHRVWNYAGNFVNEVELGIDAALGDGTPAANLARSLRQHLKEPERIYRRFRIKTGEDENGNPIYGREWKRREYDPETGTFRWVKDDPADYHPGTGVYRSSVKNAMRLARTEINMAYREAEYLRWQQLDFVVGFRVCLSNNHTIINPKTGKKEPLTDICDELAGDYPKTFKFLGWHPNCRCYVVPIMEDYDEYNKRRAGRLKAIVRRESYTSLPSRRQVTDVPPNFLKYIESIADRSKGWKSQPYYIRDNFVGGRIAGGLKPSIPTKTMNDVQPCTDYDTEIAKRKQWAYAFGLDVSKLDVLRTAGEKAPLRAELDRLNAELQTKLEQWTEAEWELKHFINDELSGYPELATKYAGIIKANTIGEKNYYLDCIARLKQAFTEATAELATASKGAPTKLSGAISILDKAKVDHRAVTDLPKPLTEAEIITKVGGGDNTSGSCASAAFAYAGNRCGFDVRDFRGGESMRLFSRNKTLDQITTDVGGVVKKNGNDYTTAKELLSNVVEGKEYYFGVGEHVAIIRKTATGYEYLELQSPTDNGWKPLTTERLKNRFGCKKSHTKAGIKYEISGELIDIDLLKKDSGFKKLLGYLNTADGSEKKGTTGTTK